MNPQFQQLKDLLCQTWHPKHIIIAEEPVDRFKWEIINWDPSAFVHEHLHQHYSNYIQESVKAGQSEVFADFRLQKGCWGIIGQEEARNILNKIIAILHYDDSEIVSRSVTEKIISGILNPLLPPVRYLTAYYGLTSATWEERLVVIDQEKLLFVMRVEFD